MFEKKITPTTTPTPLAKPATSATTQTAKPGLVEQFKANPEGAVVAIAAGIFSWLILYWFWLIIWRRGIKQPFYFFRRVFYKTGEILSGLKESGLFSAFRGEEQKQHGSAGFAYNSEIKELTNQPFKAGDIQAGRVKDLLILNKLVILPRETALKHTLVVGPTGAGKSRSFFLPNCYNAGRSSFIATDPKSELWNLTAGAQIKPLRFAPAEPDSSAPFNFVAYCKSIDYAEKVAGAVIHAGATGNGGDKFWADAEEQLLTAILVHTAHSDTPTATHAYELLTAGTKTLCEILENSGQKTAKRLVASFADSDEKVQTGVIQGLSGKLRFLENPAIRRFTSSTQHAFDFGALREQPIQIYWCLKQDDVARLQVLTTIFFSIIITQLLQQETGQTPVNMFFDEFANVGKIKGFESHITLLRGQGIAVSAGLQSTSQLEHLYGRAAGKIILDNFNNKFILSGLQGESAEEFSKQLGEGTHYEQTMSYSTTPDGFISSRTTTSTGDKTHGRRLLTADELRRIPKDTAILISTNLRPIKMKRLFFNDPPASKTPAQTLHCPPEIATPEYKNAKRRKKTIVDSIPDFEVSAAPDGDYEEPTRVRPTTPNFTFEDLHPDAAIKEFFGRTDDDDDGWRPA
jgi:type IV secretion system protein VirD4